MSAAARLSSEDLEAYAEKLRDRVWRLNNLYWITDKDGNVVRFRLNRAQRRLLKRMHWRNVILKARQLGFSTFIQIYILDRCLFNSNQRAGVIAHTLEAAEEIFTEKIRFAFDRLPDDIREALAPKQDRARSLRFSNGSSIYVGTSLRSGTYQMLHVSEMGKIAAKWPERAREIITGSIPAVHQNGVVWIESTAEGREGAFFNYVKRARDAEDRGHELAKLEWKFHFFPWWEEPTYRISADNIVIHPHLGAYFETLKVKHGVKLDLEQKAWYALQQRDLGEDMKREHPSYPDEAFEQAIEGAFFASEFRKIRAQQRITRVPHQDSLPVHTAWDLGMNDDMSIWFFQVAGREVHAINYFADSGEGWAYYGQKLDEIASNLGYRYGKHWGPHDLAVRELGAPQGRMADAAANGIVFEDPVPRVPNDPEGRNAVRQILPICWFDEELCDEGIKCLESYRREWDDKRGCWKSTALHNWASHGYKAFETLARADIFGTHIARARPVERVSRVYA